MTMRATRPHLILLGGFLGAGKTAAMIALGEWLRDQGIRPAFITNDQGTDLVDTRMLEYCGHPTEEIAGGCFCCRFDELVGATRRLRGELRPDVFVAEAVGSCTDLAATVSYPMRRLLGEECTVAPLSVLVDPVRARRALGLDSGDTFSENIQYIYHKQLEEADVVVVAKCELLPAEQLDELLCALRASFPRAEVLAASAHRAIGLDSWFRRIVFHEQKARGAMELDYDRYADGESRLGWLNARVMLASDALVDGNAVLRALAAELHRRLSEHGATVAHLKMTLGSGDEMAAINLVRNDFVPELGVRLARDIRSGILTVNMRAEAAPELLERVLHDAVSQSGAGLLRVEHFEAFRPGRPVPTHRDVTPPST